MGGGERQHGGPQHDDHREALDQAQHHATAENHNRHAEQQADQHQVKLPVRRTGYAQDVVNTHQRVGDHDGAHGGPKRGDTRVGGVPAVLIGQELVGNPQ